jgi:hypothetical protein
MMDILDCLWLLFTHQGWVLYMRRLLTKKRGPRRDQVGASAMIDILDCLWL